MTTQTRFPAAHAEAATGPDPAPAWPVRIAVAGGRSLLVVERGFVPAAPRVARTSSGAAECRLTVLLGAAPRPGQAIADLVVAGRLSVTLSLAATAAEQEEVAAWAGGGPPARPLFATDVAVGVRRVAAVAEDAEPDILLSGRGAGAEASLVLQRPLARDTTVDALDLFAGVDRGWTVATRVQHRTAAQDTTVRLTGRYADVHRALADLAPADGAFDEAGLDAALRAVLAGPTLTCHPATAADQAEVVVPVLRSAVMFLFSRGEDGRRTLRPAPGGGMPLDVSSSLRVEGKSVIVLDEVPLGRLVAEAMAGTTPDAHVDLVVVGPAGPEPSPRLVDIPARARTAGAPRNRSTLVARPELGVSLALLLTADSTVLPTAAALRGSDAVQVLDVGLFAADDVLVRDAVAGGLASLPLVDDPAADHWPDAANPARLWYRPDLTLSLPAPTDDPATSPFLFLVRSGSPTVDASGALGTGLLGTIRMRVRLRMPEALASMALLAGEWLEAVPMGNLSVQLDVPFRTPGRPDVQRQRFAGTAVTHIDGSITSTFELLDNWVRLAYGSIAVPGFQAEPSRLLVGYAYRAYRAHRSWVDDVPTDPDVPYPRMLPDPLELVVPIKVPWPGPEPDPLLVEIDRFQVPVWRRFRSWQTTLIEHTIVVEVPVDVSVPCRDHPTAYRTGVLADSTSVGCQDALRLGEATRAQFTELTTLGTDRMRVFRSLQQPNRVLVLPRAYRITRYGPAERDRAYRPVSMVYATLGDAPAEHRYFLTATLQPDLSVHEWRELGAALSAAAPAGDPPALELATDPTVGAELSYRWAIPPALETPVVRQLWDTFQISVSARLADAVLLTTLIEHGGLAGDVTFALPDGTRLTSGLLLDTRIVGPWGHGPIELGFAGGQLTLTNHCERTVDVRAVTARTSPGAAPQRTSLERTLTPRSSATLAWSGPTLDAWPVADERDGPLSLQEIEVFVQDVSTVVRFVNQLDLATHGLRELTVEVRLLGRDHVDAVVVPGGSTASLSLTLPLTGYLAAHTLDLRLRLVRTDGQVSTTAWRRWALATDGGVVAITAGWLP